MHIAVEQGSRIFVMCPLLLGWSLFQTGTVSEGLQRMHEAISSKRERGIRFYYEYELLVFADALLKAGELDRARQAIDEALEFIRVSGNRLFEVEAKRLKGAWLAASSGATTGEAEAILLGAIATAEQQGALSFALRASVSLAQGWHKLGRNSEAHGSLARIYERFTEGLATADLQDAKALLKRLQST